ncbi:MAG: hypothetical protein EA401_10545 [Planctomycetota bacterium]|nr:MAG: hypothetical protein EA401_10545 [Planctomycetota bacterium]
MLVQLPAQVVLAWEAGHRTMHCAMATNLDVDTLLIEQLMRLGGFKSKREAVDAAVAEALAWRRQLKSCEYLGTVDFRPAPVPSPQQGPRLD